MKCNEIAEAEEVLKYLTKGMRGQLKEEVVVVVGSGDGFSEAQIVNKNISIKDSNKCAELLGKRYGLFTEKIEQQIDTDLTITIDYGDDE